MVTYNIELSIIILFLSILNSTGIYAEVSKEDIGNLGSELHESKYYPPESGVDYPSNVYWGDTHVHTNLSMDAYNFGNRKLNPADAYRFALGEKVTMNNGLVVKINKPLDFLVIADHASNVGVMQGLERQDPELLSTRLAKEWAVKLQAINDAYERDPEQYFTLSTQLFDAGFKDGVAGNKNFRHSVWKDNALLADQYNMPGVFTAFIGYEWTEVLYNLHRVVIFKDSSEKAASVIPFSQYDSNAPEDLWAYMQDYENRTGGEVLAIPHNGNLSYGFMFALEDSQGQPISTDYAKARHRWEPLYEVTQMKGDGETHPSLSFDDEFADFETRSKGDLAEGSHPVVWRESLNLNHYASWVDKVTSIGRIYHRQCVNLNMLDLD